MRQPLPILYFAAIALCFTACTTNPQKKAEKAVQQHVKENLPKPESYTPLQFGELSGLTMADLLTQEYEADTFLLHYYKAKLADNPDPRLVREYENRVTFYTFSADSVMKLIELNKKNTGVVKYEVKHKYRHKKGRHIEVVEKNFVLNEKFVIEEEETVML